MHLTDKERDVFEALLSGQFGERVRLEQERISFGALETALATSEGLGTVGDRWGPLRLESPLNR